MKHADLFTERFKFSDLKNNTEFIYKRDVWCKLNDKEADKINNPCAGNITNIPPNEIVYINHHDAPF